MTIQRPGPAAPIFATRVAYAHRKTFGSLGGQVCASKSSQVLGYPTTSFSGSFWDRTDMFPPWRLANRINNP